MRSYLVLPLARTQTGVVDAPCATVLAAGVRFTTVGTDHVARG